MTATLAALAASKYGTVRVRFEIWHISGSSGTYADAIQLIPWYDFMSVHNTNIDPYIAPQFRTSTDDFATVDTLQTPAVAFAVNRPAFYTRLSAPVGDRYVQLRLVGTNSQVIAIGEWCVGQRKLLDNAAAYPYDVAHKYVQLDGRTNQLTEEDFPVNLTADDKRAWDLSFRGYSAEKEQFLEELHREGRGGALPGVLVPDEDEVEVAYCRFQQELSTKRIFTNVHDYALIARELPGPMSFL